MKIVGTATFSQSDWKHVYSSVLNFANEEIEYLFVQAKKIYAEVKEDKSKSLSSMIDSSYTEFQTNLILKSLTKEGTSKLYSPKKKDFKRYTNRTTSIDLGDFQVTFNKVTNTINFESSELQDLLDEVLRDIPFVGQFINMTETISWPKKPGPRRAIRGVSIGKVVDDHLTLFYQKGTCPPNLKPESTIVLQEPAFLKASPLRKVNIDPPVSAETHTQTVHDFDMELL